MQISLYHFQMPPQRRARSHITLAFLPFPTRRGSAHPATRLPNKMQHVVDHFFRRRQMPTGHRPFRTVPNGRRENRIRRNGQFNVRQVPAVVVHQRDRQWRFEGDFSSSNLVGRKDVQGSEHVFVGLEKGRCDRSAVDRERSCLTHLVIACTKDKLRVGVHVQYPLDDFTLYLER